MNRREIGENNFLKGYNCTQSVVLAFKDLIGIDEDSLLKIASPFGGGMGRLRDTCGAVSGMVMVIGYIKGYSSPKDIEGKKELYSIVQTLVNKFKEKNGSYVCKDLLGLGGSSSPMPSVRNEEYYKKRPCKELVGDAVEILDEYLNQIG